MAPYDLNNRYFEFWSGFQHYVRSHSSTVDAPAPKPKHWVGCRVIPYVELCATVSDRENWIKAEVALHYNRVERAERFAALEAQREEIESEVGSPLTWNTPSAKVHLTVPWSNPLAADPEEVYGWLLAKMERLHEVIIPRL